MVNEKNGQETQVTMENDLIGVYRQTVRPLYAYVSCRTGGQRALAEDIVQETYIRAWEAWKHRPARDPMAWLRTVAHNLLVSHFRKVQPGSLTGTAYDPAGEAPDLSRPETVARLQWGLGRIGRGRARLLESFYFEEKSVREIAADGRISERAVEGRLRRAREALRRQLARFDSTQRGQ
jgi:RNA polymerase sigma-70 factor (ECF subfamily)